MPPSDNLRAGQRVFILNRADDQYLAMLAAEDYYGVGQSHFYGTITSFYGRNRYQVLSDAGEELLLYTKDFDLVEDTPISDGFGRFFIVIAIIIAGIAAIGYLQ